MKVSFDFDGCLTKKYIQEIAKQFIFCGNLVYITTTRRNNVEGFEIENSEVFEIAEKVGIPKENIRFTNYVDKIWFLEDFDLHFDDDEYEIDSINRSKDTNCKGILVGYKNYKV